VLKRDRVTGQPTKMCGGYTPTRQAELMKQEFDYLAAQPWMKFAIYFNAFDSNDDGPFAHVGIFNADFSRKQPTYDTWVNELR
jgi:hypothetical protein